MSADEQKLSRLQAVLTSLLKHQLSESLAQVEEALHSWRGGELDPFAAHAEVLKHAARSERMASRIAQVDPASAGAVLRDAFDAALVTEEEFIELVGVRPVEVSASPPLDDESAVLPDKQEFVEELLTEGPVLVHIDARVEGVCVPPQFGADPKLVLRFGYGLSPAIVDLEVDEDGIAGTLTFGGVPFYCILPWEALYAAVAEADQRGMVWPDDVPAIVLDHMANKSVGKGAGPGQRPGKSRKPTAGNPENGCGESERPVKRRASHLKLVD